MAEWTAAPDCAEGIGAGGVDCGADCAPATVATAKANAATIAALEVLNDAVMTSPLVCSSLRCNCRQLCRFRFTSLDASMTRAGAEV